MSAIDRKKEILLVEDEGIIAADLQHRLQRLGYRVPAIADTGRRAIQLARRTPFDLVLMDIRLKGRMDGIETARALRRECDVPVVYVTAHADRRTVGRASSTDALGYVVKPVRDAPLRSAIELSLRHHQRDSRAATDLQQTRQRCELIAHRLNQAKENECRRLGRELHDDIQQRLTAVALEMEIQRDEAALSPPLRAAMTGASLKLRRLCRDLHRLSHHLYPRVLDDMGLVPAVRRLCRGHAADGLHVAFQHQELPAVIPAEIAVSLYRVIQEGLLNVRKHARTDRAQVLLHGNGSAIVLRLSDEGAGFDPALARQGSPLGLRSMSERIETVGGKLEVSSRPGTGTVIRASIPLPEDRI